MKTYRPSTVMLVIALTIDLMLMCVLIGFITMPIHLFGYFNQSLTLAEKSLILKTGILSSHVNDIRYSKINSIVVSQGILGSIFGYGTITIFTGNDVNGIQFMNVDNPGRLKAEIDNLTNNN